MHKYWSVGMVCILCFFTGWLGSTVGGKFSPVARASTMQQETATRNLDATSTQGRYQIFHVYYSTSQQGTGIIDSQTGRVWLMGTSTDKAGNKVWGFDEAEKSSLIPKGATLAEPNKP